MFSISVGICLTYNIIQAFRHTDHSQRYCTSIVTKSLGFIAKCQHKCLKNCRKCDTTEACGFASQSDKSLNDVLATGAHHNRKRISWNSQYILMSIANWQYHCTSSNALVKSQSDAAKCPVAELQLQRFYCKVAACARRFGLNVMY